MKRDKLIPLLSLVVLFAGLGMIVWGDARHSEPLIHGGIFLGSCGAICAGNKPKIR